MVDRRKGSERVLIGFILQLAIMVAIVLIYLLAMVFKTETPLMKIGDEITAFFYWLDVTLTRLLH